MANRPVCKPYYVDIEELIQWNIPAVNRIVTCSLRSIIDASEEIIFPEMVREFWGGARIDETGTITGEVMDYALSFDMDRISYLLHAQIGGARYDRGWKNEKDINDIRQTLYGVTHISNANATRVLYLTPAASLVHVMIVNVFCPRVSQHNYIKDLDVFIIYHILKKIKLDLVHLVYDQLERVQSNTAIGIPYGFLITQSLRDMVGMRFAGWNQFDRHEPRRMSSAFLECRGVGIEEDPESDADVDDDDHHDDIVADGGAAGDPLDNAFVDGGAAGDPLDNAFVDYDGVVYPQPQGNMDNGEDSSNVVNLSDTSSTSSGSYTNNFSGITRSKRKRILPGSPSLEHND